MYWKERANQIKINIPAVFLALQKKETPFLAKFFAAAAIVYLLSPIDLIPDFIPVIGHLDDLILVPLFITLAVRLIPKEVFAQCQEEAKELVVDLPCARWYYAIPIFIIWVLILYWVSQLLF